MVLLYHEHNLPITIFIYELTQYILMYIKIFFLQCLDILKYNFDAVGVYLHAWAKLDFRFC
jgi:hypothetical protein